MPSTSLRTIAFAYNTSDPRNAWTPPNPSREVTRGATHGKRGKGGQDLWARTCLLLTVGPLVDVASKEILPATVMLAETTSKNPDFDPTPDQIHDVIVTVSNVFFEGEAQAPILNRGARIGELQITRAPFAVSLVSDAPVVFREDTRTAISIRNDSRDSYVCAG